MGVSRVFWDTNLFIYLLEGSSPQSARVIEIRERMLERDDATWDGVHVVTDGLHFPG